jgi:hypothetical protein
MRAPSGFQIAFFVFVFLVIGVLFSIVYIVAFVVAGGMPREDGTIISPVTLTVMYITTSLLGGFFMGVLRRLFASRYGAVLVGTISVVPMMAGGFWVYNGSTPDWSLVLISSIMLGVPAGIFFRREYYEMFPDIQL